MSNVIVAGIINRKTGEITNTTCLVKEKTAIRLKVRDELGCKHGQGDFMGFEFGITNHMAYYRRQMLNEDPNAFRGLQILNARYNIYNNKTYLERMKKELAVAEEVAEDCSKLYAAAEDRSKELLINELTESGQEEAQASVNDAVSKLSGSLRTLKKLEDEQADYEASKQPDAS